MQVHAWNTAGVTNAGHAIWPGTPLTLQPHPSSLPPLPPPSSHQVITSTSLHPVSLQPPQSLSHSNLHMGQMTHAPPSSLHLQMQTQNASNQLHNDSQLLLGQTMLEQPNSPSDDSALSASKKKRKRCGECPGCFRKDNCGDCGPCRSVRSHQICKMRKCDQLKTKKEKMREVRVFYLFLIYIYITMYIFRLNCLHVYFGYWKTTIWQID